MSKEGATHVKRQKAMENTHSLDRFGFTKASDPIRDQVSHFCYDLLDFIDALFVCVIVSSHPCQHSTLAFSPDHLLNIYRPECFYEPVSINMSKQSGSLRVNAQPCWVKYFCSSWNGLGVTLLGDFQTHSC